MLEQVGRRGRATGGCGVVGHQQEAAGREQPAGAAEEGQGARAVQREAFAGGGERGQHGGKRQGGGGAGLRPPFEQEMGPDPEQGVLGGGVAALQAGAQGGGVGHTGQAFGGQGGAEQEFVHPVGAKAQGGGGQVVQQVVGEDRVKGPVGQSGQVGGGGEADLHGLAQVGPQVALRQGAHHGGGGVGDHQAGAGGHGGGEAAERAQEETGKKAGAGPNLQGAQRLVAVGMGLGEDPGGVFGEAAVVDDGVRHIAAEEGGGAAGLPIAAAQTPVEPVGQRAKVLQRHPAGAGVPEGGEGGEGVGRRTRAGGPGRHLESRSILARRSLIMPSSLAS